MHAAAGLFHIDLRAVVPLEIACDDAVYLRSDKALQSVSGAHSSVVTQNRNKKVAAHLSRFPYRP